MKSKQHLKEQAISLRKSGMSIGHISQQLGIAKSSASVWLRGIPHPPVSEKTIIEKSDRLNTFSKLKSKDSRDKREQAQEQGKEQTKNNSWLHLAGCMLYWAEGSKNKNLFTFSNTDKYMLKLMVKFLIEELRVSTDNMYCEVRYHEGDPEIIKQHWESELGITIKKPTQIVRNTTGKKKKKHPMGLVVIVVKQSTKHCQHIFGAIKEYGQIQGDFNLD